MDAGPRRAEHPGAVDADTGKARFSLNFERQPLAISAAVIAIAAVFFSFNLGRDPLGASEAYSAFAAAQPSVAAIVRIPILDDPGKQLLYYIVLHFWAGIFGTSEAALRAPSVIFGLIALVMLLELGRDLFDDTTAAAALAMWAFTPIMMLFAWRARMYTMLIAIALSHLYALRRVRDRPTVLNVGACGVLGAAMIYTHLGGIVILGAEAAILLRDFTRGRRSIAPWLALGVAALLFAPYLPVASAQSRVLIHGHPLDYISPAEHYSLAIKILTALGAAAIALWLIIGRRIESGAREPFRFSIMWIVLPILAFLAGSIILHPMFQIRYVSPALALASIPVAAWLAMAGAKVRNLAAFGISVAMLLLSLGARPLIQPWGAIARMVSSSGTPRDVVFLESGFISYGPSVNVPNGGFPHGYYSIPFDYYFHGRNPLQIIAPYDSDAARRAIAAAASSTGGAWLISWKHDDDARRELPAGPDFIVVPRMHGDHLVVFRITRALPHN